MNQTERLDYQGFLYGEQGDLVYPQRHLDHLSPRAQTEVTAFA